MYFQWGLTLFLIIFIICEVAGVPKIVSNVTFRSLYEVRKFNLKSWRVNGGVNFPILNFPFWRSRLVPLQRFAVPRLGPRVF